MSKIRITKDPEERKKEILDAAIRVFSEKGYEKTSITDIAKSINIAQGLCYRYFASKEELFDAALEEYSNILIENMMKGFTGNEQNLSDVINKVTSAYESDADVYYGLFHGKNNRKLHDQLLIRVCEKLSPIVKKYLQDAVENKQIDLPDITAATSFCVYGQLGILLDKNMSEAEKMKKIKLFLKFILNV
ncbi:MULTISPECIES: TetR/AcrR family transcriptional regulator [Lachnospiraceae]|jgi:AcrR family transcriptional regulator|uniref:TetR/AcrR family transcriptional regulator n=1 Tax=Lachnospiraceae TaxID=186803 RepID=UPI001FAA2C8F|nr:MULTISPECIES: TetR/AcrR family transcriptional regulator [Lachnospiraceae]